MLKGKELVHQFFATGINANYSSDEQIDKVFSHFVNSLPQSYAKPNRVTYYGAGCAGEQNAMRIAAVIAKYFTSASFKIYSDLMEACHALCGNKPGLVAILGTGSSSCLYDGNKIVKRAPSLGYLIGDEGSGAVLGKHLIHDLYTGVLSHHMRIIFEQEMHMNLSDIIDKVYRQPQANRFLASLSEFIHRHLDDDGIRDMVYGAFSDFANLHLSRYGRRELPVSFVGSIAWHYQTQLSLVLQTLGFHVGTILKSPLEGLITYHQNS